MSQIRRPRIALSGTHHIDELGTPLYAARFDEVLAFHLVGEQLIAPVSKEQFAWHINIAGNPIYPQRFYRCFGFYCGYAAVISAEGWFHIQDNGAALYAECYVFAGNYQEQCAVVANAQNEYLHIDCQGTPLYSQRWQYCGDFREGIAVVQSAQGLSTHIYMDGSLLHSQWFTDLDVFHKGFARAKTQDGWCHIDRNGCPIYNERYASVEPFYNGFARCEQLNGGLVVIDEVGNQVRKLREPAQDSFTQLSADMVGYWKTLTISTAVELGVFDKLPSSSTQLAKECRCSYSILNRLMRALQELGLVVEQNGLWSSTEKGGFLNRSHSKTLADAALEYADDLLLRWQKLPDIARGKKVKSDLFLSIAADSSRLITHHRMLESYAKHDYERIVEFLPIKPGDRVLDAGGGTGILAQFISESFPSSEVLLGDLPQVIEHSSYPRTVELDLFSPWPVQVDRIILARVLHDWSDKDAQAILLYASKALQKSGSIIVIEMILGPDSVAGSLCDLHLLTVTGGQERSLAAYEKLAASCGLKLVKCITTNQLVSIMSFENE